MAQAMTCVSDQTRSHLVHVLAPVKTLLFGLLLLSGNEAQGRLGY